MKKLFWGSFLLSVLSYAQAQDALFAEALENGRLANEGFRRCDRYLHAWLAQADSATGLIPRNLQDSRDYWNAYDAAADNYPFMVLTSVLLRPALFAERMTAMLRAEQRLTSRIRRLPDTYSFSKRSFKDEHIDTSQVVFGSAEYMKDGLIPLTEWLGQSPWLERMTGILDDLRPLCGVPVHLEGNFFGNSADVEVNGDLLQVLSRMYWLTKNEQYLDWAVALGNHYLSEAHLPSRTLKRLRLRDHGCEIIAGLSEIYATVAMTHPALKKRWQPYLHELLDCILAKGRNADGLFYNEINPVTGQVLDPHLADTWGYILNAIYTVYQVDHIPAYRQATLTALRSLEPNYRNHPWEGTSSDGYADAIEGALNLHYREPMPSVKRWIDGQIQLMWAIQQPSGLVEGWHGDGNFARTSLMHALWKTAGLTVSNWREDLVLGASARNETLHVFLQAPAGWRGALKATPALHRTRMHLPKNYPRINQFQEWFPIDSARTYTVTEVTSRRSQRVKGQQLLNGYPVAVPGGKPLRLVIESRKR